MSQPVNLIALRCTKCETPVPANPDEIAWACENCGAGLLLHEKVGLEETTIHYHAKLRPEKPGRPFWIVKGQVTLDRKTYDVFDKKGKAQKFWAEPRDFYIPAYNCEIDELVNTAMSYLEGQPELTTGSVGHFQPVTLGQEDIQAVTEYVIIGIEAHRKDDIKEIKFTLKLSEPQLWILPQVK